MKLKEKQLLRQKRCWRIRKKIKGTAERPRLSIHLSGKHIYVQCIDDNEGRTLCALSTLAKSVRGHCKRNVEGAKFLGEQFAAKITEAGIQRVVFDRGGRRFHGCVKSFAEVLRQMGLVF